MGLSATIDTVWPGYTCKVRADDEMDRGRGRPKMRLMSQNLVFQIKCIIIFQKMVPEFFLPPGRVFRAIPVKVPAVHLGAIAVPPRIHGSPVIFLFLTSFGAVSTGLCSLRPCLSFL
jgi:hypothetical protein